ncbi:hypothetical protein AYO44_13350 [Planctomycetaceae bacterium SCGC AG-212-F19]|nr:hypothetical protein AYO44_13350 [Planctomycetaceae bacterium SCGC AG-212-F19]
MTIRDQLKKLEKKVSDLIPAKPDPSLLAFDRFLTALDHHTKVSLLNAWQEYDAQHDGTNLPVVTVLTRLVSMTELLSHVKDQKARQRIEEAAGVLTESDLCPPARTRKRRNKKK